MRLIDADALIANTEVFCDMYEVNWTIGKVRAWIGNTPTIEAEPVKHGEWKPYQTPIETRQSGWICTNCSGVQSDVSNGDTNYCPNCGAKMDGGNAE